jgi:hypothetical protein
VRGPHIVLDLQVLHIHLVELPLSLGVAMDTWPMNVGDVTFQHVEVSLSGGTPIAG